MIQDIIQLYEWLKEKPMEIIGIFIIGAVVGGTFIWWWTKKRIGKAKEEIAELKRKATRLLFALQIRVDKTEPYIWTPGYGSGNKRLRADSGMELWVMAKELGAEIEREEPQANPTHQGRY